MKNVICIVCATAMLTCLGAEVTRPKVKPTPERLAELRAKREESIMRRYGGTIINRSAQQGKVLFVNAQKRVDVAPLRLIAGKLTFSLRSEIAVVETSEKVTVANAGRTGTSLGGQVTVFIVDDVSLPTLLVAHEDGWALLNVAPLLADKPKDEVFAKRFTQETYRAFAFLCGAGESVDKRCVMQPIARVKDLDALSCETYGFEAPIHIKKHLPLVGVTPYEQYTYMDAVKRGNAPAPTNVYQRAIFKNGGKALSGAQLPETK